VGSVVTGAASGLGLLLLGRIIDGGSGASIAVAQAAAADLAAPRDRSRLFGLLGAAFGIGFVAGPALGAVAALAGPRVPFFLAGGIAAVNTVVALVRLPETRPVDGGRPKGATGRPSWQAAAPLIGVAFSAMVAFSAFEATFAIFGERRLGFGIASAAGVFSAVGAVIVVVQAGLVHPVVSRLGEGRTLVVGLVANVVGLGLLAGARSWALAAPALLALTVGQGLVQTTMGTAMAGRADPSRRGQLLGVQQSASALARVAGPALGGVLIGAHASGLPYVWGAGLTGLAAAFLVVTLVTGRDGVAVDSSG
jgi:DHA1 family tetracycline resistance protein-like MFS transporter